MEPALLEATSAAWASLSAIAVVIVGALALAGGRARPPGSVAFAAFAIVWGAHILAGRWMAYVGEASAARAHLVFASLLLPLPYFLVQFARTFTPHARGAAWRALSVLAVALPFATIALLLVDPALVYRGPTSPSGRILPAWGPLYPVLVVLPFYLALGLTLVAIESARRGSRTARTATPHALLAAGLAAFVAFSAANNLAYYAADALATRELPLAHVYSVLFALLSALVAFLGVRALLEARRAPTPAARRPASIVALATLVPLAWGFGEGLLAYSILPRFSTVGLWRLAGVALIAYALARWRMPELASRSRQTTATALGIAAAAASGGLVVGAFLLLRPDTPLILLAGLAIPLAALPPSVRLARRVLHVSHEPDLTRVALSRRLETYRAALEASLARGSLDEDEDFLAGLRHRLAITGDVHDALVCIARTTVLAPPDAAYPGYERLRLLGEGAHGRAWLARQRHDDELVVIKEPRRQDDPSRAEFRRQARLTERLRHENLVGTHRFVDTPQGSFLVLDFMPGGSLDDRLANGPIPLADALRYARDVLRGLEALHAAGLVHADVKPANVLLDEEGRARLADFGVARSTDLDETRTNVGPQGTLSTMAPEQLEGGSALPASDVYSAGALLYRLIAGAHYLDFSGLDERRALAHIRSAPPRLPHARIPPGIEAVLRKALAKDPAERYASAARMREALDAAASSL